MNQLKYKYKKIEKYEKLYKYYDEENCIIISIFKSGFIDFYTCVEEEPHFGAIVKTLNAQEIMTEYGINTFLRKDKLNKINDSKLQKNIL